MGKVHPKITRFPYKLLLICLIFSAVGFFVGRVSNNRIQGMRSLGYAETKKDKKCLQLVIWISFQSIDDREEFLQWWTPLAQYVAENEPGLLSYEIGISDRDPLQIIVFERYIDRNYLENVHQKSDAYWKFKNTVSNSNMTIVKEGMSYIETDLGFIG